MVDRAALEVVDKFCYLGDMISVGGGAIRVWLQEQDQDGKSLRISDPTRRG